MLDSPYQDAGAEDSVSVRVAEIYESLQGEGFLTGTPSVFVRTSGCNLRCRYCDTPFASWNPEGEDSSVDEVFDAVAELQHQYVVITGGEPMLFAELVPLCDQLRAAGKHITVETAGTLSLPVECDLMSVSPKLQNSTPVDASARWIDRHEKTRHAPDVIRYLVTRYPYQMKFVVSAPEDCEEVLQYLVEFPEIDRERVMLMPEGCTMPRLESVARWLEPFCAEHDMLFCPRRQIEWYGSLRGT